MGEDQGIIAIEDPENGRSWYEIDTKNARIYEKELFEEGN
jgi:hypothetical protein